VILLALFGSFSLSFKRIYYFSNEKIVVADDKNEYIDEIKISEIISWNVYTEIARGWKKDFLVIKTAEKHIIIEKNDYTNYDLMVNFFKETNLYQDENLKDNLKLLLTSKENMTELDGKFSLKFIYSCTFFTILFWILTSLKSKSNDIQYFVSEIKEIHHSKKSHRIDIKLKKYPQLLFIFKKSKDVSFFSSYNYNDGNKIYVNQNKMIKIGISKADYEWRVKNTFINFLEISTPNLDAENYQIIE
jgi:hypothetical protein